MSLLTSVLKESNGSKRGLAGVISALVLITSAIPSLSIVTTILTYVGGLFGLGGLVHAKSETTLTTNKTSTLAAVFAVALSICYSVPSLHQYVPVIQEIAGFLGIGVATMSVTKKPV